jgi:membrane-bound inhibitor of C-type lysozyme
MKMVSVKIVRQGMLGSRTYRLSHTRAASGVRYTGDGVEWWTKGETANLYQLASNTALARDCTLR